MPSFVQPLQGYDDFNICAATNSILVGSINSGDGQTSCSYRCCTRVEDVYKALDVSASISASFGIGSGDAKSQFISTLNQSSTSVYVVLYSSYSVENIAAPTGFSTPLPTPFNELAFYQAYGDSWVISTQSGIEFFAVYTFNSMSVSEQTQVIATLSASGISDGGSVTADFAMNMQNACNSTSTTSTFNMLAPGYAGTLPTIDTMVSFALGIQTYYDPAQATTLSFETRNYSAVPGFPSTTAWQQIGSNVKLFASLAQSYAEISQSADHAAELQSIYNRYGYTGDTTFSSNVAGLQADIANLNGAFQGMQNDPTQPVAVPPLNFPSIGSPTLNVSTSYVSLGGGTGGDSWSDLQPAALKELLIPTELKLIGGPYLNALESDYASPPSVASTDGESKQFQVGNWGVSGDNTNVLFLGANERIQSISTTWCNLINSVTVTTAMLPGFTGGQTVSGPTSPDVPDPFNQSSWQMSAPGAATFNCFLGLAGRAGKHMDSLSVLTATFMPANWAMPARQGEVSSAGSEQTAAATSREPELAAAI